MISNGAHQQLLCHGHSSPDVIDLLDEIIEVHQSFLEAHQRELSSFVSQREAAQAAHATEERYFHKEVEQSLTETRKAAPLQEVPLRDSNSELSQETTDKDGEYGVGPMLVVKPQVAPSKAIAEVNLEQVTMSVGNDETRADLACLGTSNAEGIFPIVGNRNNCNNNNNKKVVTIDIPVEKDSKLMAHVQSGWSIWSATLEDEEAKSRTMLASGFFTKPQLSTQTYDWVWRRQLKRRVRSCGFETFFAIAIILNAGVMGIEAEAALRGRGDAKIWSTISYVFTAMFVLEFTLRVLTNSRFFCVFQDSDAAWNYFDLSMVVFSVLELVMTTLHTEGDVSLRNLRLFRLVRITRLVRVLRIARLVRFIRALRTLIQSILVTLKQVFWAYFLLMTILYSFALIFAQAVCSYMAHHNVQVDLDEPLGEYWGTVPRCLFTLFMSISGGVSWHVAVRPLSVMHWGWVMVFVLYILFVTFAVLNVITGVFCESAIESARLDSVLVQHQFIENRELFIHKVKELFGCLDKDGSGTISYHEMEDHLTSEQAVQLFAMLDLQISEVWELFKLLDTDGTSTIDIDEFVIGCMRLRGGAKALDMAKLSYEQKLFRRHVVRTFKAMEDRLIELAEVLLPSGSRHMRQRDASRKFRDTTASANSRSSILDDNKPNHVGFVIRHEDLTT
eukprot:TRINITY_DN38242_c0_g2_i1.p1 TRINITY_DN38242_c0_g2~~TRINITY_DN38242_c0_g2_i1.p1  ORF type:complete len:674 (+),score=102.42 TRINITY_DN38242_c0_g2_i1:97-2118(+)